METLVDSSVGQRKLSMLLLGVFSGIALLLASLGIYGVMSYSVAQRSRELGIRMALGARRTSVLGLVVRQGMALSLAGVAIGLAAAFGVTRLLSSQLFGVAATDPGTFATVAGSVDRRRAPCDAGAGDARDRAQGGSGGRAARRVVRRRPSHSDEILMDRRRMSRRRPRRVWHGRA